MSRNKLTLALLLLMLTVFAVPAQGESLISEEMIQKETVHYTGTVSAEIGSYERSFTWHGQSYHHIIDPATASPTRSGLTSVTIIGPSGARCDALSTALFVMGPERAADFWRTHRDFEAVFIHTDGHVTITAGAQPIFSLAKGYESRPMEVLK